MSQAEKLYELLSDGKAHSTVEIMAWVYGDAHLGISRISARIWDLSQGKWPGKKKLKIASWRDAEQETIWWYRLAREEPEQMALFNLIKSFMPI